MAQESKRELEIGEVELARRAYMAHFPEHLNARYFTYLDRYGFDLDDPDITTSKRANLVFQAMMEIDGFHKVQRDMQIGFGRKLHIRRYRRKYERVLRTLKIRSDVAARFLNMFEANA